MRVAVIACVWAGCIGGVAMAEDVIPPTELQQMRAAAPEQPIVPAEAGRRLLVYNGCKGFRHSAIPYGSAAFEILGEKTGAYEVVLADDPAVFKPGSLQHFDAVLLNNTTGELFDDPMLKKSLLEFLRGGGGLVGIHGATDCFYQWPEFGKLMGGYFDGHPWNEEVTVRLDEPGHPLVAMFGGKPFKVADEIYQFRTPYSRERLRVLLSLDTKQTDMTKGGIKREDGDFAVSWVRNYGRGRVFYCSLGHRHEIFRNPAVLKHYLAGIQFALGDLQANAVPSARVGNDGWLDLLEDDLHCWIFKPGAWKVEEGVLTRAGGGYIWTQQEFGDFVLELEYRISAGGNSGVFFRTGNIDVPVQTGIEMQVLDSYGKATVGRHDAGAIYDIAAPKRNAVNPPERWNAVRLMCRGSRIHIVLNGIEIIDIDLDEWTEPHLNPDGSKNKFRTAYQDMPRRGRIGFQDHGDAVWYRNVRIQPLSGEGAKK